MDRLDRTFYEGLTSKVAKNLLGKRLVRRLGGTDLIGTIVEVEAYGGSDDPASHAFRGMTPRNEVMFGEPGHAYVYFTYGNHYCLNVTTQPVGVPGAILVRALEPLMGVELMMKNRGTDEIGRLTDGPGKLTRAMGIGRELNGEDLVTSERLYLTEGNFGEFVLGKSSRVGIRLGVEREWRFFVKGNAFVSKIRPSGKQDTNP